MGKKITYINAKGEEIAKSAFNKSEDCQITIDPKNGKWELLAVCNPTKEMLTAAGDNLAQWLTIREKMAKPYESGSKKVVITDDRPDEFTVEVPTCSIRRKDTLAVGTAWSEWAKKFTGPAPQPAPEPDPKPEPKTTPAPQPAPEPDPKPEPKTTPAPQPEPSSNSTPKWWELTKKEREALVDSLIDDYKKH